MGYRPLLIRSPKKEEEEVPDATASEFDHTKRSYAHGEIDIIDELDDILGDENGVLWRDKMDGHLSWDFMDWETGFHHAVEEDEGDNKVYNTQYFEEEWQYNQPVKTEQSGFWELDEEKRVSLNLNLNYQDVLDAWSDRGPLWADDCSISTPTNANGYYMGEVPMMETEERRRREASVLRYKEKRQTRLFCKKIRYQVRKLNADKRPRLKGRFVKRVS